MSGESEKTINEELKRAIDQDDELEDRKNGRNINKRDIEQNIQEHREILS